MIAHLAGYHDAVDAALAALHAQDVVARIWARDHTVWRDDPTEIANRLGWLDSPNAMQQELGSIDALVAAVRAAGYTHALLLGMGGSSLAPEVFARTFGVQPGYLHLDVLDSTDAGAVLAYAQRLDFGKTLFIVSTKSGGTVETLSFFKYFYNRVVDALGPDDAGGHFIAITDPGSSLQKLAEKHDFRATFLNDPDIGGRYSALSFFGLVPAGLVGMDLARLLARAQIAARDGERADGDAARLGAILGALAKAGRDKLTLVLSPALSSFGDWVEQLVAESTGKAGTGILPVVGEPPGPPAVYSDDRLFVHLRLAGDTTHDAALTALQAAGHPVVRFDLSDLYDLGQQYFLWEFATAVAGQRLGIQPFDQPNVESAKVLAREMVVRYHETGTLPGEEPALVSGDLAVYGTVNADSPESALRAFIAQATPGAYIALHAYIPPTAAADETLLALRTALRDATRRAVTVGYGPRFLHSTGQLHKGDAGNGLFIQFTAKMPQDAAIPDEAGQPGSSMTFGVLKDAQALGDRQALLDAGRGVLRFDLGADIVGGFARLVGALS